MLRVPAALDALDALCALVTPLLERALPTGGDGASSGGSSGDAGGGGTLLDWQALESELAAFQIQYYSSGYFARYSCAQGLCQALARAACHVLDRLGHDASGAGSVGVSGGQGAELPSTAMITEACDGAAKALRSMTRLRSVSAAAPGYSGFGGLSVLFPFGGRVARRVGTTCVTGEAVRDADAATFRQKLRPFYDRMPGLARLIDRVVAVADAESYVRVRAEAEHAAAKPKRTWAHSALRRARERATGQE